MSSSQSEMRELLFFSNLAINRSLVVQRRKSFRKLQNGNFLKKVINNFVKNCYFQPYGK